MFKEKKAFTFIELVISTVISAIVLLIIFWAVADSIKEISYSIKYSNVLVSYNSLFSKINNYRNIFKSWSILINNTDWTWNDVLILNNTDWSNWVIFWVINKDTMKLEENSNYQYYNDKIIWYRNLSEQEIIDLNLNSLEVYNYTFYNDKIFEELKIKDFQLDLYNSWSIIELTLGVNVPFHEWLKWKKFSEIWSVNIKKIVLDF
jgi:prepilin-type N-terminal cleavage/methylation domain-containing protein